MGHLNKIAWTDSKSCCKSKPLLYALIYLPDGNIFFYPNPVERLSDYSKYLTNAFPVASPLRGKLAPIWCWSSFYNFLR